MYIETLDLGNIRTFTHSMISFIHPDARFRSPGVDRATQKTLLPRPRLPNVNLLLGDNASGKTTVLQAIALAALGPAAREAQLPVRRLVRYSVRGETAVKEPHRNDAYILASLYMHEREKTENDRLESMQQFERRGELESMEFAGIADDTWTLVYESNNTAFFCVAYGSTRRVESAESPELGLRRSDRFERGQRVISVFQDGFPLYRLANWLPRVRKTNPSRYEEVFDLTRKDHRAGPFSLYRSHEGS